jgi:putative peptide zinc metalloprotease protein
MILTPRRRLLAALAALVVGVSAGTLPATAADGDTAAVAVNTRDGSTLFRFAFSVRQILGDVVDQSNTAVAYASCTECRTVAISVQVLLVSGSPDTVTPTNLALALNDGCTECETLASAYQFVFGNGDDLRFTAEGRKQIAEIRRRFQELRKQGDTLSLAEVQTQADALAGELREVLASEVTPRGPGTDGQDAEGADGQTPGAPSGASGESPTSGATGEQPPSTTAPTQPTPDEESEPAPAAAPEDTTVEPAPTGPTEP